MPTGNAAEQPPRFAEVVGAVVSAIPPGEVLTYGEVAAEAGAPGAARAVGGVLARSGGTLPWWRVVTSTGRLVPGHEREHARRLRAEGVPLDATRRVRLPRTPALKRLTGRPDGARDPRK